MFVTSVQPFFTFDFMSEVVDALSARPAAALLVTPFVKLFTSTSANPSPLSVPGDFTEATFVGYAGQAMTLPLLGPANLIPNTIGGHREVDFLAGAVVAPGENILGYYVVDDNAAPTRVYLSELFQAPIPIINPGDTISLDVIFGFNEACLVQQ
jgi:hypothetical protein